MAKHIRIEAGEGGGFKAYLALPASGGAARPAVIVLQEIFGVNPGIRAIADRFAAQGYLAAAPDLFWRAEPGLALDPEVPAERDRAFGLMRGAKIDDAIADIEATIRALRARADCDGRVGIVGYCWGGLLAFLSAARTDVTTSVGYYGGGIDQRLGEAHAIARPLMLHFGEADAYIPPASIAAIVAALADKAQPSVYTYPGADHAFARVGGAHRDEGAAALADERTAAFLARHLGPGA